MAMPTAPEIHLETAAQWHDWLATHHDTEAGVWLVSWRTSTGRPRIDYEDVVCEALRYGWVDSTVRVLDDERNALYLARRKKGSTWARSNKERVARLTAQGRMQPSGLAAVERAKADGSWTVLDPVEDLVVPEDLAAALDARPGARAAYEALPPSARKQILWSVVSAKRPETRARRVDRAVATLVPGPA